MAHFHPPQQAQPAERQQAPAQPGGHFVYVRHRHDERGRLAVDLGDLHVIGGQQQRHQLADVVELLHRERHEAVVLRPGIVEDVAQDLQLARLVAPVQRAHPHLAGNRLREPAHDPRRLEIGRDPVGEQVARALQAAAAQQGVVVRARVAHHDRGRRVETLDQQPALLVDREIQRSAHTTGTVAAQPRRRRVQQCRDHGRVVLGLDQPEGSAHVVVVLLLQAVELGADPAHRTSLRIRHPGLRAGVLQEGIASPQALAQFHLERRDPVRIIRVQALRQAQELAPGAGGVSRLHGDRWMHGHLLLVPPGLLPAGIAAQYTGALPGPARAASLFTCTAFHCRGFSSLKSDN